MHERLYIAKNILLYSDVYCKMMNKKFGFGIDRYTYIYNV